MPLKNLQSEDTKSYFKAKTDYDKLLFNVAAINWEEILKKVNSASDTMSKFLLDL